MWFFFGQILLNPCCQFSHFVQHESSCCCCCYLIRVVTSVFLNLLQRIGSECVDSVVAAKEHLRNMIRRLLQLHAGEYGGAVFGEQKTQSFCMYERAKFLQQINFIGKRVTISKERLLKFPLWCIFKCEKGLEKYFRAFIKVLLNFHLYSVIIEKDVKFKIKTNEKNLLNVWFFKQEWIWVFEQFSLFSFLTIPGILISC